MKTVTWEENKAQATMMAGLAALVVSIFLLIIHRIVSRRGE